MEKHISFTLTLRKVFTFIILLYVLVKYSALIKKKKERVKLIAFMNGAEMPTERTDIK